MKSTLPIKLLCAMLVFFVMATAFASPARAQGLVTGDTVSSGQIIDDDVILFGNEVVIDGDVNGNVLALGNTVTVNGKVDGSLFAVAQNVVINGEVSDSVYTAALTLDFGDTASVARNVTYLGASTHFPQGASIGRDLKGIFFGAVLGGDLGGDIRGVVGPVEVVRFVLDQLNVQVKLPSLRRTTPTVTPVVPSPTPSSYLPTKVLAAMKPHAYTYERAPLAKSNPVLDFLYSSWLTRQVKQFATLFILGTLLILLLPAFLKQWTARAKEAPALSAGYGLMAIIFGNIAAVILMVVVLAVGAGLYALKLDALAFLTLGLGASAVGVMYAVFFLTTVYLSKIVVVYLVGWLLLRRWERASRWWMLLPFLLGLLIYALLAAIPFLGWAISLIVAAIGAGAIYLSLAPMGKQPVAPEAP